jgi:hypothetical protein
MAKTIDSSPPSNPPPLTNQQLAQKLANVTGFGVWYIAERLDVCEGWDTAREMVALGSIDQVAELLHPANKAI